jgi:hypothetical protein
MITHYPIITEETQTRREKSTWTTDNTDLSKDWLCLEKFTLSRINFGGTIMGLRPTTDYENLKGIVPKASHGA